MSTTLAPALPAYAAELLRLRRRGARPETLNERLGRPPRPGLDNEPILYVTDRWRLAKMLRELGRAAIVIEPGPLYDFAVAKDWVALAYTKAPFPGLREQLRAAGAKVAAHSHDWLELEEHAEAVLARRPA